MTSGQQASQLEASKVADNTMSALNNSSIITTNTGATETNVSKDLHATAIAFQEKSMSAQRKRNRTYTKMEEQEQLSRMED